MKKHSPTPWIQGHSTALGTDAIFTLNPPMPVAVVMDDNRDGNTEFIILAVNHHEELVKALRLLLCGAERAQANGVNQPQLNGGVVLARAALAKLEVKP